MGSLSATGLKAALRKPGRHGDGDGLFLQVSKTGSASWIVRVQKNGRRRDFGLGGLDKVPLSLARERARQVRMQVEAGVDPIDERNRSAGVPTFREVAEQVYLEHKRAWRNGKHQKQWISTLETYAFPFVGDLAVDKIETGHVRDILGPIWLAKPETARRMRQRIGAVLDYAAGKNWRQHALNMQAVSRTLPRQPKRAGGFAAMPFDAVPAFVRSLREKESASRLALEALILTAARSGEIRGAHWDEIDLERKVWTIPAVRMKAGKEHLVPLSPAALNTFNRAKFLRPMSNGLIFPGQVRGKAMSDMTMLKLLRDGGHSCTVHGFRSAFRDWVAERTNVAGEVAEAALAHAVPNRVEAAYRRTDFFEKRRDLMDAWGAFVDG